MSIGDLIGAQERQLLEEGRRRAFARSDTTLDESSPLRSALAYYTGQPYATPGVRDALVDAIRHGLHCLIISGGYGVVRAEEPIHRYNAHLGTQIRSIWQRTLPTILRDYVRRQHMGRSFVLLSQQYAQCVPRLTPTEERTVPTFTRGRDEGAAMRVVPQRIEMELSHVLSGILRGSAG